MNWDPSRGEVVKDGWCVVTFKKEVKRKNHRSMVYKSGLCSTAHWPIELWQSQTIKTRSQCCHSSKMKSSMMSKRATQERTGRSSIRKAQVELTLRNERRELGTHLQ